MSTKRGDQRYFITQTNNPTIPRPPQYTSMALTITISACFQWYDMTGTCSTVSDSMIDDEEEKQFIEKTLLERRKDEKLPMPFCVKSLKQKAFKVLCDCWL